VSELHVKNEFKNQS